MVKNLPAVWQTQVRSLGQEDPLEEGMAPTAVFSPGKSHGQRSLAGYSPWDCKESDVTERLILRTANNSVALRISLFSAPPWDLTS